MNLLLELPAREKSDVTLTSQLESILEKRVIRASEETGSSVTLREKPAKMRVKLIGLVDPVTTIRMGGKGKLNHSSNLKQGAWNKICDYLLISRIDDKDHAVFVELKKSLGSMGDPEEQLLRSRPLLEYLLAVCDVEEGINVSRPKMSYVIVYERIRFDKSPLRPDISGKIDEIEYKSIKIRRFQGTELDMSDLLGL